MTVVLKPTARLRFIRCLSVWIGFVDHSFLSSRLYTNQAEKNVTSLAARLFGVWTLLAAALRFACAIDIHNKVLYNLTFLSFILALGHFVSEVYFYKTAKLTLGVCAPLFVSSISILMMAVGYWFVGPAQTNDRDETAELAKRAKFS